MTTAIDPELRTKIDAACRMEEEFTKLYNEKVAKKRHQMTRLYMDNGLLVWNGNGANGKDNIQKYFQELPRFEYIMNTLTIIESSQGCQCFFGYSDPDDDRFIFHCQPPVNWTAARKQTSQIGSYSRGQADVDDTCYGFDSKMEARCSGSHNLTCLSGAGVIMMYPEGMTPNWCVLPMRVITSSSLD
ncbi:AAEL010849-PA [Aedes aegypti]|uniref:AAEL010849-PA n=1 Tax=Aedes aegypti TaxID=7159 RepID=Q16RU7_AEDAE|nr:AAEL010849-PA [Aedes aegypti]